MLPSNLPPLSATEIVALPVPAIPAEALAEWRASLEEMAALPDPVQRNDRISQFMAPFRVRRIEEAEDSQLLAAACRATMHLSNADERRAVVVGLLTDHSIHAVGQCDDATILHDVSRAMHALDPEEHAEALKELLTAQGVIDTLTQDGHIHILADLAHDAATWLPRDDTLEWVMGELMTDDVLDAATRSTPDSIQKIVFAAWTLPDERRAVALERLTPPGLSSSSPLTWQQIVARGDVGTPNAGPPRVPGPGGPAP